MMTHPIEVLSTVCFSLAVLHTFSVKWFQERAHRYPQGSVGENFFHLLGEVEVVFGLWASLWLFLFSVLESPTAAKDYFQSLSFTEPAFVFVIMALAGTRPIIKFSTQMAEALARALPIPQEIGTLWVSLTLIPLLGSLVTEPAAMTVAALLLYERYYSKSISDRFKYAVIGVLFVNISIGGVLTPYAAPPVLMVAQKFGWDLRFMLTHFGHRAMIAVALNSTWVCWSLRKELKQLAMAQGQSRRHQSLDPKIPYWVIFLHLAVLAFIAINAHSPHLFVGAFLFFLGLAKVTQEFQSELKLRESLLVGFFLGGLVVFGPPQAWWLRPLLEELGQTSLFLLATGLTAITDNAALTYLGAQVPHLSEGLQYALVAGAVSGGGLTIIANAPNPAGYSILNPAFGPDGLSPALLFRGALLPTGVVLACFWGLPSLG